jgi:hypothetical protein
VTDSPDDARLEALLRAEGAGEPAAEWGPGCLSDELVAALADDTVEPSLRPGATRHLAECARCRRAVASVAEALESPEVAAAVSAAERPSRRRIARIAFPAAAAAVLFIALFARRDGRVPSSDHRAPGAAGGDRPVAVAPIGITDRPESLRWQAVAGADAYRVTLYHADGRVLYTRELRDTAAGMPDSIEFAPGATYLWMVEARTDWNRWSSSPLLRFTVGTRGRP